MTRRLAALTLALSVVFAAGTDVASQQAAATEWLVSRADVGRPGGQLVVIERAEPRTLNPVVAVDAPSKEILARTTADLIHVDRETQQPQPALARSWTVSPDGRRFTLSLRHGVRFSDGQPFDADDVVFSFTVYLDEKVGSPQRDLLIVGDKPITVRKIDQYTVQVDLAEPYAIGERLFDSVAMLPRHLLETPYTEGRLARMWAVGTAADAFAGLGPFRLREYVPGQRLTLERNPFYWKTDRAGTHLPYLDRLVFVFVPSEDAQALRFQAGDADVTTRLSAANFEVLMRDRGRRNYDLLDAGPGLDYTFLFFNQNTVASNDAPQVARRRGWFRQLAFRQAVSLAIDRDAIVRLVYRGRATPLWGHVPPGNKLWVNRSLPRPSRSPDRARERLRSAGFSWNAAGALVDKDGQAVDFTIVTNTGNTERIQIATIVQDDLKQVGIRVGVVTLELRTLLQRLLTTHDYDACVLALGASDGDPSTEMNVWLSSGGTHLWNPEQASPATPWEAEIDTLMRRQLTERDVQARKRVYDRVQQLVAENLPVISLVSPSVLAGTTKGLGNL
ncbi:MAG TPA: ABC transporter substrate-binding protein, partial [Vicinamibacterales bacterium]|nr:ABC transporter substrate-binding protein [Vicinamibacterales bacterium]